MASSESPLAPRLVDCRFPTEAARDALYLQVKTAARAHQAVEDALFERRTGASSGVRTWSRASAGNRKALSSDGADLGAITKRYDSLRRKLLAAEAVKPGQRALPARATD